MSRMNDVLKSSPFMKIVFKEFNFRRWIKIVKGRVLYRAYIFDEDNNEIGWTKFYNDFDERLEGARKWVDHDIKTHFEFVSSTLTEPRTGKEK